MVNNKTVLQSADCFSQRSMKYWKLERYAKEMKTIEALQVDLMLLWCLSWKIQISLKIAGFLPF